VSNLTVGRVEFGPDAMSEAALRAENMDLIRRINRLVALLERCLPPDNATAAERSLALHEEERL
jgi:hypothetical protein